MSWEQVYEQWLNDENLEGNLKKQLADLKADPEKLEDALRTSGIWYCRYARNFRTRY